MAALERHGCYQETWLLSPSTPPSGSFSKLCHTWPLTNLTIHGISCLVQKSSQWPVETPPMTPSSLVYTAEYRHLNPRFCFLRIFLVRHREWQVEFASFGRPHSHASTSLIVWGWNMVFATCQQAILSTIAIDMAVVHIPTPCPGSSSSKNPVHHCIAHT
jgi:hypothetical protein